jgi:hypothetical protein
MTVERVPSTRHFDAVRAFFDVPLQVWESPKMSGGRCLALVRKVRKVVTSFGTHRD